jgi:hypothetical protein
VRGEWHYAPLKMSGCVRVSFSTCWQSTSGWRSPALDRAMILLAMACLTSSPNTQSDAREFEGNT